MRSNQRSRMTLTAMSHHRAGKPSATERVLGEVGKTVVMGVDKVVHSGGFLEEKP